MTTEEVALVRGAFLRAKLESRYSHPRIEYDCAFDFTLPRDGVQIVTYDSGAGRVGLGPDIFLVDNADRLALRSLIGARFDVTGTAHMTMERHYW